MPLTARAATWIPDFRWLCTLFRNWLGKRLWALRGIIFRLRRAAQRIWLPFRVPPKQNFHDYSDNKNPFNGAINPVLRPTLFSAQPANGGFDASGPEEHTTANTPSNIIEFTDSNSSQPAQVSIPQDSMSTPPTSIEGSATLTRASTLPTAVSTSDTSHLSTIFPEAFQRYWRNVTIPRKQVRHTIPAHTTTFAPDDLRQPSEWVAILHPEGAKYFFHPKRRIFTDADLCKVEIFAEANRVVDHIIKDIQSSGEELSPYYAALLGTGSSASVDLVVDLTSNYGEKSSGYYFINHSHRCPFWLHPMQVDENLAAWHEIEGPIGQEQLRHEMEWQYWIHCTLFPSALSLTKEHVDELQDLIIYSIGDMSTSLYSTVGVSIEQLQDRLSLVEKLQYDGIGSVNTYARIMGEFVRDRFYHFHGEPCARLSRVQSVYDLETPARSYFMKAISPILFFAPEVHLESLRKSYVDKTVFGRVWVGVIDKLNTEWQDFTLLATVVLNANVAFLSAQSVDVTYPGRHTPAQIASYLSTLASVGSIILGLLLVRQNRTKFREIAAEISAAMSRRSSNTEFGLELLAVIFSLPYALLMWSIACFLAAFLLMCFRAPDIFTRVTIGSAAAAIFVLVFWCIWDAWDMQEGTVRGPLFLSSWCRTAGTALYSIFHPSLRCFGAEADHAQGDGVPNTQSLVKAVKKKSILRKFTRRGTITPEKNTV